MGCPILLGYAEKAKEVSETWAEAAGIDADNLSDMVHDALRVRAPFKEGLEKRARAALRVIVQDMLRRALQRSRMRGDIAHLDALPEDLEYEATSAVLQQLKDRAIAWKVNNDMLVDGKTKTEGELEMVFIERVWLVLNVADNLIHDMAQESYTAAGTALAHVLAAVKVSAAEWLRVFEMLKEAG